MARLLARLVALNDAWARPLGEFNQRWVSALFRPIKPIRDLLNGRWLGHPLHAASTDLPIGLLLGTVILDFVGQPGAADIMLVATIITMLLSALSGLADYADTERHCAHAGDPAFDADGRGAGAAHRSRRSCAPALPPIGRCRSSCRSSGS